jgi:hypothetical protein
MWTTLRRRRAAGGRQVARTVSALPRIAAELAPDRIVVGFAERRGQMPIADLLQLRYGGMAIDEASTAYEQLCGRVLLGELRPSEMLLSARSARARNGWSTRRWALVAGIDFDHSLGAAAVAGRRRC